MPQTFICLKINNRRERKMQYLILGMLTAGAVIVTTELFLELGF